MRNLHLLFLVVCLLFGISLNAQVVTSSPAIIQQSSTGIEITFYASRGSGGLKGTTTCYAHTGVITNKSASNSDWKYAPAYWGENLDKYKLKLIGTNKWKLTIGDIRSYYGITDPTEVVKKLAFVFRNTDGSQTGKEEGDGDIFIDVYPDGLAVNVTTNVSGNILTDATSNVTLTANATLSADINLYINSVSSTPIASASGVTTLSKAYTFPKGDYSVIAEAKNGSDVVRDTLSLCHRNDSQNATYSGTLKEGANVNADGTVTFCLYAPQKSNVMLIGEWNDYKATNSQVMNYQGDKYFWITISSLDMDKEYGYYFVVDDNISVADPYAKLILDPWNDKYINENATIYPNLKPFPTKVGNIIIAVFHGNESKYNWEVSNFTPPAKDNLVIYELLFRDFTDEKSVNAAIAKLDYLQGLGINAIELMPIQEFDGNNSWGYNPNFYFAPDKAYGTKEAYQRFIDECHKRGIAVILDIVLNHSWGQHPWCKMYWDSTNNRPSADNPFQNAVAPHNWSVGNDWKQENTHVQDYFCDMLKYWIQEYKVDGYRFDLAKGLGASNSYANDYDGSAYNASRVAIMKKYTDAIKNANSNAYAIYEYFVASSEENEMGNYGGMSWKKMTYPYTQAAEGYADGSSFIGMRAQDEGRPAGSTVGYMESHDEERVAYAQKTYGASGIKDNLENSMCRLGANAAFSFLVPGAKMIWQFGELGYDESLTYGGSNVDPKPTHWEYLDNEYRKGLYNSYSEIIKIRVANPDLFNSDFSWNASQSDWNNGRMLKAYNASSNKELVAVYNTTPSQLNFTYDFKNKSANYYINSKSYNTAPSINVASSLITVPAHSYVVVTNMADPSGVEDIIGDANDANLINIYPNPATDVIRINSDAVKSLEIYSITGSLVGKAFGENSVDVSNLAKGNYLVRIATDNSIITRKLIKE